MLILLIHCNYQCSVIVNYIIINITCCYNDHINSHFIVKVKNELTWKVPADAQGVLSACYYYSHDFSGWKKCCGFFKEYALLRGI